MKNDLQPGGKRTLFHSFADAFRGVWDCVKSERNMRIHLTACAYVLFFASRLNLSRGEWACLFLTMGLVTATESMNTAVEKLCDFAQKQLNPRIRVVKDVAAGAVLLSALAAVLVGGAVLFRPELWTAVVEIVSAPWKLGLFLLSAAAALAFVFAGPMRLAEALGRRKKK